MCFVDRCLSLCPFSFVRCIVCSFKIYGWMRRRGRDRMVVDLQLPMQSVHITTDVVSSNLDQGEVYNIM